MLFEDLSMLVPLLIVEILFISFRYFFIGWLAWSIFWRSKSPWVLAARSTAPLPTSAQIRREIRNSLSTILIFSLGLFPVALFVRMGWANIYPSASMYGGWPYLIFSFIAMTLMHDTYFYWTHRLIHHPKVFKLFHKTHHLSHSPTPWTSYAFDPAEAGIHAISIPLMSLVLPLHPGTLLAFLIYAHVMNVMGHLGHEIFPAFAFKKLPWKLYNTPTHHGLHHLKTRGNYGLYFSHWDKWMGTLRPETEAVFNEAVARRSAHGFTDRSTSKSEPRYTEISAT